ncbi:MULTISPECIES: LPXTG cell wall anchor domain-containing protein [Kitasatospora]|uniref:Gram-positive cocci surface proteins LPxTG domain-containing protein n=1 Tax=Kitasatospora setae (strain ATCC 33774 / DSM 43861 / JCM 3304 / KCC A-0304 / NBRC 14216 / KM-6054) TaxID=452652 RepID=E4NBJ5_KITSK|nr:MULTISPECIES: LPXTG cell wall anchor domain-containing protein [Kitasatospora]BAJ28576.1 hypothetical protein KSE_27650 [Kitasatospora setae KM-6054]
MNTRRTASSAAIAALLLAATTAAGGTAWAEAKASVPPCADGKTVLPGAAPVEGGPAHEGEIQVEVTGDAEPTVQGDTTTYRVRITETNRTGADYRHVTLLPVYFTQLGVMNQDNSKIYWEHGGTSVKLPTRPGCDPSVWADTAALDVPLADGKSVSFDLRITTPTAVAEKIKELSVSSYVLADGKQVQAHSQVTMPRVTRTAPPTTQPTAQPTAEPSKAPAPAQPTAEPSKAPAVTPVGAAGTPAPAPSASAPAAADEELASTGGGRGTGTLAGIGALLLAAGGAVLYTVRRRRTRNAG